MTEQLVGTAKELGPGSVRGVGRWAVVNVDGAAMRSHVVVGPQGIFARVPGLGLFLQGPHAGFAVGPRQGNRARRKGVRDDLSPSLLKVRLR